jgi:hypothetical protein
MSIFYDNNIIFEQFGDIYIQSVSKRCGKSLRVSSTHYKYEKSSY